MTEPKDGVPATASTMAKQAEIAVAAPARNLAPQAASAGQAKAADVAVKAAAPPSLTEKTTKGTGASVGPLDATPAEVPERPTGAKKSAKGPRSQRSISSSQAKSAAAAAASLATDIASPPAGRRKRKPKTTAVKEVEPLREPRLSPEPEDDLEQAKRVREKNRLRLYRYHRNLEKRANPDHLESGPKPTPVSKPAAASKPSSKPPASGTDSAPKKKPAPLKKVRAPPPAIAVEEAAPDSPPARPASPLKSAKDGPRLSPVPEGATHEEVKRIKAKNRLRLYRFHNGPGIKEKRAKKKRSSSSGSEEAGGEYEEYRRDSRRTSIQGDPFSSASAYSSFSGMDSSALAAMIAAAASAQTAMNYPPSMTDMARTGIITPRSSESGHMELPVSPRSPKPRKPVKAPSGPPRLSPEPEDPSEAKRVRSKNRVRMHRYNQQLAAAQQAAESKKNETLTHSAKMPPPHMPGAFAGHGSLMGAAFGRGIPHMMPSVPDPMGDVYRHVLEGSGMMARGGPSGSPYEPTPKRGAARPPSGKRQSESGREGSKSKKARKASPEAQDAFGSFYTSLEELPFRDLPSNLRELALETYIKETMGMAQSLQALESQLRVNQVTSEAGPMAQQSVALLSAVSQLRADAWGLSQLRLSQYAAMSGVPQAPPQPRGRRPSIPGAEQLQAGM